MLAVVVELQIVIERFERLSRKRTFPLRQPARAFRLQLLGVFRGVERIRDDQVRADGRQALASTWGETDPNRALRWLAGLSDVETRTKLATLVLRVWISYDPPAAVAHIRRMRNDRQRDATAAPVIQGNLTYNDPSLAEELYENIADPEARQRAASMLYAFFRDRDPERAERYRADAGG